MNLSAVAEVPGVKGLSNIPAMVSVDEISVMMMLYPWLSLMSVALS